MTDLDNLEQIAEQFRGIRTSEFQHMSPMRAPSQSMPIRKSKQAEAREKPRWQHQLRAHKMHDQIKRKREQER